MPRAGHACWPRIRSLVLSARNAVARGVDLVQVRTNFEIGRHIVQYEQQGEARAAYAKELLALLAERLTAEFGKGFGRSNIAYARSFYLAYQARRPFVQTASGQLPSGALQPEIPALFAEQGRVAAETCGVGGG